MITVFTLQTSLPLALIVWLALRPPRNRAGFWMLALCAALMTFATARLGIWLFPPWWVPTLLGFLLVGAIAVCLIRSRQRFWMPAGAFGWLCLILLVGIAGFAAIQSRTALRAARMPEGRFLDLSSPLGPGTYLVANGGAAPAVNAHATLLDLSVARHRPYRATGHGVDLVEINGLGFRADGILPADPARYEIFGNPVIAPCAGDVVVAVDGLPDMTVPQTDADHLAGNHVILRCADAEILLAHFRPGTLVVHVGQSVGTGGAIAQVGNSGNTSEPHLHINAQMPGTAEEPFSGAPIPIRINGRYLVRNQRLVVPDPEGRS